MKPVASLYNQALKVIDKKTMSHPEAVQFENQEWDHATTATTATTLHPA